jgi:hypothetical protein
VGVFPWAGAIAQSQYLAPPCRGANRCVSDNLTLSCSVDASSAASWILRSGKRSANWRITIRSAPFVKTTVIAAAGAAPPRHASRIRNRWLEHGHLDGIDGLDRTSSMTVPILVWGESAGKTVGQCRRISSTDATRGSLSLNCD